MFAQPANGFVSKGLIVFNRPGRHGHASRGFRLDLTELRQASADYLNQLQDQVALHLRGIEAHQRVQYLWHCDSDHTADIDAFDAITKKVVNDWCQFHRAERAQWFRDRMAKGKLRRQRLFVFVSRPLEAAPRSTEAGCDAVLDQVNIEFEHFQHRLVQVLGSLGVRVIPLTDEDHYRLWYRCFNPSWADRPGFDPLTTFDPKRTLQDNCWSSEGVGLADVGYWMDGYYHALLAFSRWPQTTYPGIIQRLTQLPLLNYQLTLNIEPLSVRDEIHREEQAYRRLQGDLVSEQKVGLERVLEKKKTKVKALMEGFLRPFGAELIVRTWAKTREALGAQVVAIKQAINGMNGACFAEPSLPTSAKRLFYQTWPGWCWGGYRHHQLYAEDRYLADLVPLSTSFNGMLAGAEALFDGPEGSLVGVRTFQGEGATTSPAHALILGKTGSGKGLVLSALLSQTAPYNDFIVMIDNGLSYELLTRALDPNAVPIIIRPNGNVTINYLETADLPITPEHLGNASGLVMMMVGEGGDEFERRHRQALISKYIQQLYVDVFEDWARAHPDETFRVARLGYALAQYRAARQLSGLDAFVEFRDWQASSPDEAAAHLAQLEEGAVLEFLKSPATRKEVCYLAFARFRPDQMPTHQMLQELMELDASNADQALARQIALQLRPWCRDGDKGCLFDGQSNVSLKGRVAHIELGQIAEASRELRNASSFLTLNHVQHHICSLPRSQRKSLIFEEASAFLTMPNGEQILRQAYEQARKYNCWLAAVFQGYQRIRESGIRSTLMGNSRQFFLLAQQDDSELNALAADLGLSAAAVDAIRNYPLPGVQHSDGHFTYFVRDHPPICGTAINAVSKELLYLAGTGGAHFEQRRKDFGGDYTNLVPRLIAFANRKS